MKKTIWLLLLLMFFVAACSDGDKGPGTNPIPGINSPQTEETDTYEVTYQYQDGVIVLTDARLHYIDHVEDDSILYFRKDTPPDILPKVGSILSSRVSDKLPYGLGNEVIECTEINNLYRCVTTVTSLDEVFRELTLKAAVPLTEGVDGFTDDQGIWHEVEYVNAFDEEVDIQLVPETRYSGVMASPLLSFNYGEEPPETGTGIYSFGKVFVTAILEVNFDLKRNEYRFLLSPRVGLHGSLVSMVHADGYKELFKKMELVQMPIYAGPVVIRPALGLELGVEGSVDGNIRVDWVKEFAATCGFVNEGTRLEAMYNNTTPDTQNVIRGLSIDANAHMAVITKCYLTAGLYTRSVVCGLAPSFKFGIDADFKMENPNLFKNKSKLTATVNMDLDGVFYAKVLKKDLFNKQVQWMDLSLWEKEWPLFPVQENIVYSYSDYTTPDYCDIIYTFSDLGLLSRFVDIYHGIKLYYGVKPHWDPVKVIMNSEPLNAESGKTTYTQQVREAGGGYTSCPILKLDEFYFEGDTCSYGTIW